MKVLSSEDKPGQSPWEKGSTDSSCQASREYSHKPGAEHLQELSRGTSWARPFPGWCGVVRVLLKAGLSTSLTEGKRGVFKLLVCFPFGFPPCF